MDIEGPLKEMVAIDKELKMLRNKQSELRKRMKCLKEEVVQYLDEVNKPGIRYGNIEVRKATKRVRAKKSKSSKEEDGCDILKHYGIVQPERVLKDVLEAMRGEPDTESDVNITTIRKR